MKAFARAPAKAILLGEHFVVHGGGAMAVALDRGMEATAERQADDSLVSLDTGHRVALSHARGFMLPVSAALADFMKEHSLHGVRVSLKSSIPSAAGLGSSASSSVAAVAAAAELFRVRLSQDELYAHAMKAEQLVHGNASGTDVFVSVAGGAVHVKGGKRTRLEHFPRFQLMLCDSGISRNTGQMVTKVSGFRSSNGELFSGLQAAVDSLVEACVKVTGVSGLRLLAQAMNLDHEALKIVGASSPTLDHMVWEARRSGFEGAKLTGAGGGGCVVGVSARNASRSLSKFSKLFANAFLSKVPGEGVTSWKGS
ncbi:MAG: mevalonate kinase [Nitrososphaerota archaeon]|nr:mevalonate kinase [Nitrososphaerota archaeon]MDG6939541.1 mevalonate kinase [Nitrososphaerota archaeon]